MSDPIATDILAFVVAVVIIALFFVGLYTYRAYQASVAALASSETAIKKADFVEKQHLDLKYR